MNLHTSYRKGDCPEEIALLPDVYLILMVYLPPLLQSSSFRSIKNMEANNSRDIHAP
jgi:hypothetical protein